jgi:hypothetical protein
MQQINNKLKLNLPLTMEDYTKIPRKHVSLENIKNVELDTFQKIVFKFRQEVYDLFKKNKKLLAEIKISTQCKVKFENRTTRSISSVDTIDINDFNLLVDAYEINWNNKYAQQYKDLEIKKVLITYRVVPGWYKRKIVSISEEKNIKNHFHPLESINKFLTQWI